MEQTPLQSLSEIAAKSMYPIDAFHFLRLGLDFTVHKLHENPERMPEEQRHVSGQQLSLGLKDFAIEQYGQLARMVLRRWRINRTEDFGQIVFAMVNGGLMQATERDSIADFDTVFDFEQAFNTPIPLDRLEAPDHPSDLIIIN